MVQTIQYRHTNERGEETMYELEVRSTNTETHALLSSRKWAIEALNKDLRNVLMMATRWEADE